jgi:hypothetical protein
MKATLLGALLLFTAACGAYQFPDPPRGHYPESVSGQVLLYPCFPAEPAGSKCAGRPAAALEIDFVNGKDVHSAVTDEGGNYRRELVPATYQVQFKSYMRIISGPRTVTVPIGSAVVANYVLDVGIRVPQPQQ